MDGAADSERPDGSTRKRPRDIRPGYTPPEETEIYKFPRPSLSYGEVVQWKFGFGFIKPDSLGANVFVHASAVRSARELQLGDRVEFERRPAEEGETSDRADNVRLTSELPPPAASAASSSAAAAATTKKPRTTAKPLVPRSVAARSTSGTLAPGHVCASATRARAPSAPEQRRTGHGADSTGAPVDACPAHLQRLGL